jgi:hypothetical protein
MFSIAKTPSNKTQWHTCKEYAGRALGGRNPKRYVTITVWNGIKPGGFPSDELIIQNKDKQLQSYLNEVSSSYKSKAKFIVTSVEGQPGILQIKVPPEWCHNRITAHLLFTHIRLYLRPTVYSDQRHLNIAMDLLNHGKNVGMDKFNEEMDAMNRRRRTLGIVVAANRWESNQHATY